MHAIAHVEAAPTYVAPVDDDKGHPAPAHGAPPTAAHAPTVRARPVVTYAPRASVPPVPPPPPRPAVAPAVYRPAAAYRPGYPPRSYVAQPYAVTPYAPRPWAAAPYAAYPYGVRPAAAVYGPGAYGGYYGYGYRNGYGPAYGPVIRETVEVEPPWEARTGLQLGARAGYLAGLGVVYSGLAFGDMSAGAVPLIIDIGWRFLPQIYVGAYGQVAPLVMRTGTDACPDGTDCSGLNWRMGVQLDYHFMPASRLDPYVGVGAGYEILHRNVNGPITVTGSAAPPATTSTTPTMTTPTSSTGKAPTQSARTGMLDTSVTDQGWEMVALTLGFDVRTGSGFGVGPFVTGTLGRYGIHSGTQSTVLNGGSVTSGSVSAVDHDVHQLLIIGLRGTFNR